MLAAMANLCLMQPEPFDPDEWPKWKCRFQQFSEASRLDTESQSQQVSTVLYCMGEDAKDILISMNITEDQRKLYPAVVHQFDASFQVKIDMILERAKFN